MVRRWRSLLGGRLGIHRALLSCAHHVREAEGTEGDDEAHAVARRGVHQERAVVLQERARTPEEGRSDVHDDERANDQEDPLRGGEGAASHGKTP